MRFLDKIIIFQNRAEEEFKKKKSLKNILIFIPALILFFGSTLFAALTIPLRYLLKKINKGERAKLLLGNDENIDAILKRERLVLIDFWAEWCGPCIMMNPTIKNFSDNTEKVTVVKINADLNIKTLKRFKIKGLPHFLLLKNGKEIKRYAGSMTSKGLHQFCFED